MSKNSEFKLFNLPLKFFLIITVVVLLATYRACCPRAWPGASHS